MRTVGMGIAVGAALVLLAASAGEKNTSVYGQNRGRFGGAATDGSLVAFESTGADGARQLTLVDSVERVMGVYRIDPASGAISLRSVRCVRWDLLMDEFNGGSPSPQEIRALVGQKR